MRLNLRGLLVVCVVGLFLVHGAVSWRLYQDRQVHLQARLISLANAAAFASHGLTVLESQPENAEERGRTLYSLIHFSAEAESLSQWAGVLLNPGRTGPLPQGWATGSALPPEDYAKVAASLSESERLLRHLADQRNIARDDVAAVLGKIRALFGGVGR